MRFALSYLPPCSIEIAGERWDRPPILSPSLLFDPSRPKSSLCQKSGGTYTTHTYGTLQAYMEPRFPTHRDGTNTNSGAATAT